MQVIVQCDLTKSFVDEGGNLILRMSSLLTPMGELLGHCCVLTSFPWEL